MPTVLFNQTQTPLSDKETEQT